MQLQIAYSHGIKENMRQGASGHVKGPPEEQATKRLQITKVLHLFVVILLLSVVFLHLFLVVLCHFVVILHLFVVI